MKSGTTTLHELLARHPEIAMCEPKEPCHFISGDVLKTHWPEMWAKGYWRSEEAYLALFRHKPHAKWVGESSTDYTKRPLIDGVAQRIAAYSPAARIVYIMRDPVERTISHYWHMTELRGEKRAPLDAIRDEAHYTDVSDYAQQLAPYVEHFGRERIHVLTFESLKADPQAALAGVCRWLGVRDDFVPEEPNAAHNVTPDVVRQKRVGMGILDRFRHSALWDAVGPCVPSALRKAGVAMIERQVVRREMDMSPVIDWLRPRQQPQVRALEAMMDRRFPEWKTLWGTEGERSTR
ncbi:MAG TPA: sulfotransferase, partial [Burkholderiaceae bacterium]|nr:sulfotransferase [Burkholderiaceae bacterium]